MTTANDIRLVQTSTAHPEQYDAFLGDRKVGYLRMRGGCFTVDCPDCDIFHFNTVYICRPERGSNRYGDGAFHDHDRERYLGKAKAAIAAWVDAGEPDFYKGRAP